MGRSARGLCRFRCGRGSSLSLVHRLRLGRISRGGGLLLVWGSSLDRSGLLIDRRSILLDQGRPVHRGNLTLAQGGLPLSYG